MTNLAQLPRPPRPAGAVVNPVPGPAASPAAAPVDAAALRSSLRRPALIGILIIGAFVFGFGVWAAVAPLAGGAVASGVISPDSSRKTVQHLEGGIIRQLLVRDGDRVAAGEPLLVLEDIQPRATWQSLLHQQRSLRAAWIRLEAEQARRPALDWPEDLRPDSPEPGLQDILDGQQLLFASRNEIHLARKRVLRQRIEQLTRQITGLQAQVDSADRQLAFIGLEIEDKNVLQAKGLTPKPELLRLQRTEAGLIGERGASVAEIARVEQQIGETELQLLALDAERADKTAEELDKVKVDLANVEERLSAAADVLRRTVVKAPVAGVIVNLRFKTVGGVVQPGEPVLDIVPEEDKLLIDARVMPTDIDLVHVGLSAQVHLLAYASRNLPPIFGTVRSVSADSLVDEGSQQPYYLARVEVDRASLAAIEPRVEIVPGMPAEVLIVTGERTLAQYLLKPFLDALRRSLREA